MNKCLKCGSTKFIYSLKLIVTNRGEFYPKYVPQVKQTCKECKGFIKFAKQTPELIETINKSLEGMAIYG